MVFTEQGVVDIYNQHVIIPVTTDTNNKKSWKTIYKLFHENYFKESKNFTDEFLHICNTNNNEPQNIPNYLKNNIRTTSLERGLFSQVLLVQRKVMTE